MGTKVEAHRRGWHDIVRWGGVHDSVVEEEQDGVGGTDFAGKETNRGEHKVEGGISGPKMPRRSGRGSPERPERLYNDSSSRKHSGSSPSSFSHAGEKERREE